MVHLKIQQWLQAHFTRRMVDEQPSRDQVADQRVSLCYDTVGISCSASKRHSVTASCPASDPGFNVQLVVQHLHTPWQRRTGS